MFGGAAAIRLAESGAAVSLFERLPDLIQGASFNANRVHKGYHYPRDEETARRCMECFGQFKQEFAAAILQGLTNAYFIAREGSAHLGGPFLGILPSPRSLPPGNRSRPISARDDQCRTRGDNR